MTIEQVNKMDCKQIDNFNFNNNNSTFEIWYEVLQHYAEMVDWERNLIINRGNEYWENFYNNGTGIRMALLEGFTE